MRKHSSRTLHRAVLLVAALAAAPVTAQEPWQALCEGIGDDDYVTIEAALLDLLGTNDTVLVIDPTGSANESKIVYDADCVAPEIKPEPLGEPTLDKNCCCGEPCNPQRLASPSYSETYTLAETYEVTHGLSVSVGVTVGTEYAGVSAEASVETGYHVDWTNSSTEEFSQETGVECPPMESLHCRTGMTTQINVFASDSYECGYEALWEVPANTKVRVYQAHYYKFKDCSDGSCKGQSNLVLGGDIPCRAKENGLWFPGRMPDKYRDGSKSKWVCLYTSLQGEVASTADFEVLDIHENYFGYETKDDYTSTEVNNMWDNDTPPIYAGTPGNMIFCNAKHTDDNYKIGRWDPSAGEDGACLIATDDGKVVKESFRVLKYKGPVDTTPTFEIGDKVKSEDGIGACIRGIASLVARGGWECTPTAWTAEEVEAACEGIDPGDPTGCERCSAEENEGESEEQAKEYADNSSGAASDEDRTFGPVSAGTKQAAKRAKARLIKTHKAFVEKLEKQQKSKKKKKKSKR